MILLIYGKQKLLYKTWRVRGCRGGDLFGGVVFR
jgi:hypothetical protein